MLMTLPSQQRKVPVRRVLMVLMVLMVPVRRVPMVLMEPVPVRRVPMVLMVPVPVRRAAMVPMVVRALVPPAVLPGGDRPLGRTMVGIQDIKQAAKRIDGIAHRTPVVTCGMLDERAGRSLLLKCENLQKVGAFKFRGACNAVMGLTEGEAARGVVTHSSGNHAQALALAAKTRGIKATIVMPIDAPGVKRRAVEGYGARVIECEPTQEAREAAAERVVEEDGATFIAPYDDARIIAGQGTTFLELHEQVEQLDALVVPLGGGGLLSGMALAARALRPNLHIIGIEPELADDARESIEVGHIVPQRPPRTVCDGLRTSLGALTFPIIREHVDEIITVPDELTIDVMRFCWERSKIVVEPSGVIGVAAMMSDAFRQRPGLRRIAIVLTGGNLDLDRLPWQN